MHAFDEWKSETAYVRRRCNDDHQLPIQQEFWQPRGKLMKENQEGELDREYNKPSHQLVQIVSTRIPLNPSLYIPCDFKLRAFYV